MNTAAWQALADLLRAGIEALGPQVEYEDNSQSETLVAALEVVLDIVRDKQEAL